MGDGNRTEREPSCGVIEFKDSRIEFTSDAYGSWALSLSDIVVIGEFSTPDGPYLEDEYVVFVDKGGDGYFACSSAAGMSGVLRSLGDVSGAHFRWELASVEYDSVVWWPSRLRGEKLFELQVEQSTKAESLHTKISMSIRRLLGLQRSVIDYSPAVRRHLRQILGSGA